MLPEVPRVLLLPPLHNLLLLSGLFCVQALSFAAVGCESGLPTAVDKQSNFLPALEDPWLSRVLTLLLWALTPQQERTEGLVLSLL